MIGTIFKRALTGIACGGLATFIALTIMMIIDFEASVSVIWMNMLASMLIGIYFGISSLIYETDAWSNLKKTIVHFSCSIIAYYLIALPFGWIPINLFYVLVSTLVFAFIYALYWIGFYLYFRKMTKSLNDDLKKDSCS